MESALMIAKVFGMFLAIVGLWMLLYSDNLIKVTTAIKNSASAFYFLSTINLLVGLFIVCQYNVWEWNMFAFVTILGWFFVLRGVLGLFAPQLVVKWMMTHTSWIKAMGIVPFVWGLLLLWTGFYM